MLLSSISLSLVLNLINVQNVLTKRSIVIIDTGLDRSLPKSAYCGTQIDITGRGIQDQENHGKYINEIVAGGMNKNTYCITNIHYDAERKLDSLADALQAVLSVPNISHLNISSSGMDFSAREFEILKFLTSNDVKVFVSAGNNGTQLGNDCNIFPTCYKLKKNFYVVGSKEPGNLRSTYSNYGPMVKAWELGTFTSKDGRTLKGTSFSSPRYLLKHL